MNKETKSIHKAIKDYFGEVHSNDNQNNEPNITKVHCFASKFDIPLVIYFERSNYNNVSVIPINAPGFVSSFDDEKEAETEKETKTSNEMNIEEITLLGQEFSETKIEKDICFNWENDREETEKYMYKLFCNVVSTLHNKVLYHIYHKLKINPNLFNEDEIRERIEKYVSMNWNLTVEIYEIQQWKNNESEEKGMTIGATYYSLDSNRNYINIPTNNTWKVFDSTNIYNDDYAYTYAPRFQYPTATAKKLLQAFSYKANYNFDFLKSKQQNRGIDFIRTKRAEDLEN